MFANTAFKLGLFSWAELDWENNGGEASEEVTEENEWQYFKTQINIANRHTTFFPFGTYCNNVCIYHEGKSETW